MIKGFRHKALRSRYNEGTSRGIRSDQLRKIDRVLTALDAASCPQHLALPGFDLHPLKGDRKGCWAVTVKANWRIVFRFNHGHVFDVDLLDYH